MRAGAALATPARNAQEIVAPMPNQYKRDSLAERFWSKVDRRGPDECWPWTGNRYKLGYGYLEVDGRKRRAPRIAWELEHGEPFPAELYALHSCDTPPCVNARHIWPGTLAENRQDCVRKGRAVLPDPSSNWQRNKTVCKNGHALIGENVYRRSNGQRHCRECARVRRIEYRQRQQGRLPQ